MNSKALVALSDSENCDAIVAAVKSTRGVFSVDVCHDGAQAIEIINRVHPSVVILDLFLPQCDGFSVMERSPRDEFRPRFLVLGSSGNQSLITRSFAYGASYYMVKPVDIAQVSKWVTDLLMDVSNATDITTYRYRERSLDERISSFFIKIGVPPHIKGYQYLREGIKLCVDDPPIIGSMTKRLYPAIAEKFDSTASKVEQSIRHAIEVTWNRGKVENINTLFGIKIFTTLDRPTNAEFIALLADKFIYDTL